ncbi:hypothetical protein AB4143_05840 [Vibrio breoganii]
MKKTIIASLLLASGACFSADHAVLNVEGEIQINGKTVINSNGEVLSPDESEIKIADYEPSYGVYTRRFEDNFSYPPRECESTETFDEGYQSYEQECVSTEDAYGDVPNDNYNPDFNWDTATQEEIDACNAVDCSSELTWGVIGTKEKIYTYTSSSRFAEGREYFNNSFSDKTYLNDELISEWEDEGYRVSDIYDVIEAFTSKTTLGKAVFTYYAKHTVIESSNPDEVGDKFTVTEQVEYLHKLDNYNANGKTYTDCLMGNRKSSFGDNNELYVTTGVACKGKGFILDGEVYEASNASYSTVNTNVNSQTYRKSSANKMAARATINTYISSKKSGVKSSH